MILLTCNSQYSPVRSWKACCEACQWLIDPVTSWLPSLPCQTTTGGGNKLLLSPFAFCISHSPRELAMLPLGTAFWPLGAVCLAVTPIQLSPSPRPGRASDSLRREEDWPEPVQKGFPKVRRLVHTEMKSCYLITHLSIHRSSTPSQPHKFNHIKQRHWLNAYYHTCDCKFSSACHCCKKCELKQCCMNH